MKIYHDISLRPYHSFGIDAVADRVIEVSENDELQQAVKAAGGEEPLVVLGRGCNMLFSDVFHGVVLVMRTRGVCVIADDGDTVLVEAMAGEDWDGFVRYCSNKGWHGLENLVAIPGTVGAAPVQNVGAYGSEAADVIHSVNVFDLETMTMRSLTASDCCFAYRDSVFKHALRGRCVVTSVVFRLSHSFSPNLSYKAVGELFANEGPIGPSQLMAAIDDLRWSKLPHPEVLGNAGSFFKNPIVSRECGAALRTAYPQAPLYPSADGCKVAAGWLIEQCGWRGRRVGQCGVYERQALVLVNYGGASFDDIRQLADAITADVQSRFGIILEREAQYNIT